MKSKLLLIVFIVSCAVSFAQENAQNGIQDGSKYSSEYRRSSIAMFTILHPADSFSTEIYQAVSDMPFPDKYDDHSLDYRFLTGTPHADRKADLTDSLNIFMKKYGVARKLISKWFNATDTSFNMDLVSERGLYDASVWDMQDAMLSQRGKAMLADAGEELIGKTFVLVNDISYIDHEERPRWLPRGLVWLVLLRRL